MWLKEGSHYWQSFWFWTFFKNMILWNLISVKTQAVLGDCTGVPHEPVYLDFIHTWMPVEKNNIKEIFIVSLEYLPVQRNTPDLSVMWLPRCRVWPCVTRQSSSAARCIRVTKAARRPPRAQLCTRTTTAIPLAKLTHTYKKPTRKRKICWSHWTRKNITNPHSSCMQRRPAWVRVAGADLCGVRAPVFYRSFASFTHWQEL